MKWGVRMHYLKNVEISYEVLWNYKYLFNATCRIIGKELGNGLD